MSTLVLDGLSPRSRSEDPVTSVDAGRAANLNASQQYVLDLFVWTGRPLADHELVQIAVDRGSYFTAQRIRSARSELAELSRLALVDDRYSETPSGRRARVWKLAPQAVLAPWQRHVLVAHGIDPDEAERFLEVSTFKAHGEPSLGGDGLRVPVDTNCPHCGWPERFFDTRSRRFGCIQCEYESDERNA